jgi:UDP-galactopyranose mutase
LIVKEYPLPTGEPYYPVPTEENIKNYTSLKSMIPEYLENSKLWFVGRLASYKYFNMDQAIETALNLIEKNF